MAAMARMAEYLRSQRLGDNKAHAGRMLPKIAPPNLA
jgi:hypothetical protein